MQFQFNSDYPGIAPDGTSYVAPSSDPTDFPPAQPISCAKITIRVYHPKRNQVATVQNVLVRADAAAAGPSDTVSWGSDDMSSSSSSGDKDSTMSTDQPATAETATAAAARGLDFVVEGGPLAHSSSVAQEEIRAYWIQRTVREAIYGRVLFAVVLRKRTPTGAHNDNAEWEVTEHHCAVKEMSWQHIRRERDRLAEDPIKEVSAMQYLKRWHSYTRTVTSGYNNNDDGKTETAAPIDGVLQSFKAILETNIMMPLDLMSDDRHLYSIMPYCDGGELFERLDLNERFSEAEARYWMHQLLNGLENMQNAGITHRDMSLENLLVHRSGALIIDMGMCLRVPFLEEVTTAGLSASFNNMTMSNGTSNPPTAAIQIQQQQLLTAGRSRPRYLINPQGTCGKWIYMSPEIYKNQKPFDGFAVDMWAAGVILFLMLTGFPPWERACQTDERFKYMTAGYLVQMLTEWEVGLTSDAMDLLQRMLFLDPKDRLSLDQVRAHPWMLGPLQPPHLGPPSSF